MNSPQLIQRLFEKLTAEDRAQPTHLALMSVLVTHWKQGKYPAQFPIDERTLRIESKIRSALMLDRCLRELEEWGYLQYFPSQQSSSQGLVCLTGADARKITRRRHRSVLPRVVARQTAWLPEISDEVAKVSSWTKLAQVVAQAAIQLLIAALNKHWDLF